MAGMLCKPGRPEGVGRRGERELKKKKERKECHKHDGAPGKFKREPLAQLSAQFQDAKSRSKPYDCGRSMAGSNIRSFCSSSVVESALNLNALESERKKKKKKTNPSTDFGGHRHNAVETLREDVWMKRVVAIL